MFLFKDGLIMIIIIVTYFKLDCADAAGPGKQPVTESGSESIPRCVPFVRTEEIVQIQGEQQQYIQSYQQPPICCPPEERVPMYQKAKQKIKNFMKAAFAPRPSHKSHTKKKDKKKKDDDVIIVYKEDGSHSHNKEEGIPSTPSSPSSPNFIEAAVGGAVLAAESAVSAALAAASSTPNPMQAPDSSRMIHGPAMTVTDPVTSNNCTCTCFSCPEMPDLPALPDLSGWCLCGRCSNLLCIDCSKIDLSGLFSSAGDDD